MDSEYPEDALPEGFVDALLDRAAASTYLASIGVKRTRETLAKLHCIGASGPPCIHEGRRPLYSKRALHAWGVRQLVKLRASPTPRPRAVAKRPP